MSSKKVKIVWVVMKHYDDEPCNDCSNIDACNCYKGKMLAMFEKQGDAKNFIIKRMRGKPGWEKGNEEHGHIWYRKGKKRVNMKTSELK